MKNFREGKIDHQTKINQKFNIGNRHIKTTNINILLNRVREENKSNLKKKLILSISIIGILSFICIYTFGN